MGAVDGVRIGVGPGCRGVDWNGKRYNTVRGQIHVPDASPSQFRNCADVDVLPGRSWHLGQAEAEELRCTSCGKRKLALFGPVCAWCGGDCV